MKQKFVDKTTYASSPGNITISKVKLKKLRPDLYGLRAFISGTIDTIGFGFNKKRIIKEHIYFGDSQPAVVMSTDPLIVVAYSDDLDCVVPLKFPKDYTKNYNLEVGSKLISINTYRRGSKYQNDIIPGPNKVRWFGFSPIIAEFISDDIDIIKEKKEAVNEDLWNYVYKLGIEYSKIYPNTYRDGRPIYSGISSF